jgi:citrate lyase beta subunit
MYRKLQRSLLFCPGDKIKVMQKTRLLRCDVAVFDLEDAVSVEKKGFALDNVTSFLTTEKSSSRTAIRINGMDTKWGKDELKAIAAACRNSMSLEAIVVPKVGSIDLINEIDDILRSAGQTSVPLWCMIETPAGVHNSHEIASHERVQTLIFGSNDLSKDLKAKQTASREPLLYSMARTILAARMHKKFAVDGVYNSFKDADGFAQQCAQGREMGFDGKSLIHPDQVEPCNVAFSPSLQELAHARAVVLKWAEGAGSGVVTVDGKMVERLHVDEAEELLALFDNQQA